MKPTDKCTFVNGQIFTSNVDMPYANAMVVQDGKIVWIGDQEDVDDLSGEVIDFQGKRVLPGFIDAHLHPLFLAKVSNQISCMPPIVHSIQELIEKIREQIDAESEPGWIESWGYDEGKLAEGRAPTRLDLDQASTEVPILVTRSCGHIVSVNSKALELASIDPDTRNPLDGLIDRDSNGVPTGILRESAKDLVRKIMPVETLDENATVLANLGSKLLAHGITGITEMMARTGPIDFVDMYNEAKEKGLKQRTVLYYIWEDLINQSVIDEKRRCKDNQIYIGGVKLFSDGSVSGQTAWVETSFMGGDENFGIQTTSKEELLAAADAAEQNGIQLVVHAMGEKAIDLIVNCLYERKGWLTNAPSVRIEHAAMPTKQAISRATEAGIAFVPQPIFLYAEIESYLKSLGTARTKQTYPVKTMLEAGIKVAFSSDAPATAWADPVNPFVGIKSAVTRIAYDGTDTGQDQRIDIPTAITLYTRAAQEVTGIPSIGQLASGYFADFIVLDQDILTSSPEEIDKVCVEETYMGGQLVYQKKEALIF